MNRIDRLTGTLLLLQTRRSLNATDIATHWEISERTVYRDLAALSEAGVPIVFEPEIGYRLMGGYEMRPIMLSETEALSLFMSAELAKKFADVSLRESLSTALLKIRSVLPETQQNQLESFKKSMGIWLNESHNAGHTETLIPLHRAVIERRCLKLQYNKRSLGNISERIVEPLGVLYYTGHWHLIAFCRLRSDYRDFRMDRMKSWHVMDETYTGHHDFSVETFLENFGHDDSLFEIRVEVSPVQLPRLKRDLMVPPLEEKELPSGHTELTLQGFSVDWTAYWLISYGTDVKVVSPQELAWKIREIAQEISKQYKNS